MPDPPENATAPTAPPPTPAPPTKPTPPPPPPAPPGTDATTDEDAAADGETDIVRLRTENSRWRREAREQKKRADELAARVEAEAQTSADRLAKLEAAERRNARATIERLASAAGFHAGEPAHELDALADVLGTDAGEAGVAERLKTIATERPYLLAASGGNGAGGGHVLTPGRQGDVEPGLSTKDAWLRA